MKKIYLALAAVAAFAATPAVAQSNFAGPRLGGNISLSDNNDRVGYGATIGHDFDLGRGVVAGVDADAQDFADGDRRTFGAGARLGVAVDPAALVFARGGVVHHDRSNQEGYQVGGGVELALTREIRVTPEYRYTDYGRGADGHSVRIGLGFRF